MLVRLVEVTGRPPSGSAVANALPALLEAEVLGRVPAVAGREPPPDVDVPGRDIAASTLQTDGKSSPLQ